MPMLKKGDTAIHYGFTNGAIANKLFARNIEITRAGDRMVLDLRHHANPRRDLSDGDYRLLITTTAQLTSAVIMDAAFRAKLANADPASRTLRSASQQPCPADADRCPRPAERVSKALS